nr:MAG TPA: hypothetical protein [Caudoviricetes sp.]
MLSRPRLGIWLTSRTLGTASRSVGHGSRTLTSSAT